MQRAADVAVREIKLLNDVYKIYTMQINRNLKNTKRIQYARKSTIMGKVHVQCFIQ